MNLGNNLGINCLRLAASAPTADVALRHIPIYGQSLSIGSVGANPGTAAVISAASTKDYMFSAGVRAHLDQLAPASNENSPIDPAGLQSIVALAEVVSTFDGNYGETVASGIGANTTGRCLFSATGRGAYEIAELSRDAGGIITDQNHWINTHAAILYGRRAAEDNGWTYEIPCFLWMQGSADATALTTRADYEAAELSLRNDWRAMASAAGQIDASAVPMVTEQPAYRSDPQNTGTGATATGYGSIAVAKINNHRAGVTVCAGPRYPYEFVNSGDLHMTSQGYRDFGAGPLAKAIQTIRDGGTWHPTHINGAPTRSGTTITVPVYVPTPPLAFDTSLGFGLADRGFDYSGANITAVTITDDGSGDNAGEITITIDAAAGGVLRCGYENAATTSNNEVGTEIRDSNDNWLCTDEWSVT